MGRASRVKGHGFEREIARAFRERFPDIDAHRGYQYRDGADAPDVIVPGLCIECKRGKLTYPKKALQQAIECADKQSEFTIPVAICKDDRSDTTVTMLFEDFLDLLAAAWMDGGPVEEP